MSEKITENDLVAQRRSKLDDLRSKGNAYPNDYRRDSLSAELHLEHGEKENDEALSRQALQEG